MTGLAVIGPVNLLFCTYSVLCGDVKRAFCASSDVEFKFRGQDARKADSCNKVACCGCASKLLYLSVYSSITDSYLTQSTLPLSWSVKLAVLLLQLLTSFELVQLHSWSKASAQAYGSMLVLRLSRNGS